MSVDYASNPADLPEGTLVDLFYEAVDRAGEGAALRFHAEGGWRDISHAEVLEEVRRVAGALADLGCKRGDRAAILSENRPEWALADYGCLTAGVVDIPVYATLTAGQIGYILKDGGARLVFLSDASQLAKMQEIRDDCPELDWVVVFDPPATLPEGTLSWSDFLARGDALPMDEFRRAAESVMPGDTATVLYTSGTTGDPKGVMLSHNNLHSNVLASSTCLPIDERDLTLSFLPLSHVFQRMVDYLLFNRRCVIAYARSIQDVPEDLRDQKPTIVVSVPRLYEKVHARVTSATGVKGALVGWATRIGDRWADARLAGRTPPLMVRIQYRVAQALVFSKISQGLGGRLRYFVSGGAPLAPEINKFFFSAGVMILEGYGLTETSPVTNVNTPLDFPANFRIGTVGKPVPGTEIQIAEDGEILVRGPQVMKGYFNRPAETDEVIDPDGWFHTGDVGELDEDGFLRITDRKKDLIVTAGGKNVAPQPIENLLKANRFFDQPVLVGDRQRFITLLVVPDFDALEGWAREHGVSWSERRELLSHPEVQSHVFAEMQREVADLSSFETPKKLLLLEEPFTIEDGSLTPTQKIKRRVVQDRYAEVLDRVYAEASIEQDVFTPW
ncbi:MAG: long-chain fatty acid--CoA ligase [Gemmatimonadota bacterium]